MTPTVSVLIVTYNSSRHIVDCLESLNEALRNVDAEVFLYDNASTDDTLKQVRSYAEVHVTKGAANIGFAAACNQLANLSSGRYLLFLNPDTRVHKGAVTALLKAAERVPGAHLYGPRTVAADGRVVNVSAQGGITLWSLFCFATGLSTVFPGRRWADPESLPGWDRTTTRHVPMLSGGALMVSRQAWTALQGFDQQFFIYAEDVDLCFRARAMGFDPLFVAEGVVEHDVGGSSSAGHKLVLLHRGKVTYVRKNWPPVRAALGSWMLLVGVGVRAMAAQLGMIPERPGRTAGHAWREAWRHRDEWRNGWGSSK